MKSPRSCTDGYRITWTWTSPGLYTDKDRPDVVTPEEGRRLALLPGACLERLPFLAFRLHYSSPEEARRALRLAQQ